MSPVFTQGRHRPVYISGADASLGWVEGCNEPTAVPTPSVGSFHCDKISFVIIIKKDDMTEADFSIETLPKIEPPQVYPVCESLQDGYDTLGAGVGDPEDYPVSSREATGLSQ